MTSPRIDTPIKDSALKRFFVIQTLICRYFIYLTKMTITEDIHMIKGTNHSHKNSKCRELNYEQANKQTNKNHTN